MSFMRSQTIAADRYVQAPISRVPSGDLASSGMSFMTGGAMPYGSNPATWSPVGGAVSRQQLKEEQMANQRTGKIIRKNIKKLAKGASEGLSGFRRTAPLITRKMGGKGKCTGTGHCHCMKGGGLYA